MVSSSRWIDESFSSSGSLLPPDHPARGLNSDAGGGRARGSRAQHIEPSYNGHSSLLLRRPPLRERYSLLSGKLIRRAVHAWTLAAWSRAKRKEPGFTATLPPPQPARG